MKKKTKVKVGQTAWIIWMNSRGLQDVEQVRVLKIEKETDHKEVKYWVQKTIDTPEGTDSVTIDRDEFELFLTEIAAIRACVVKNLSGIESRVNHIAELNHRLPRE
jgi:hypothetical protein